MKRMTEAEFRTYSITGNLYKLIIQVGTPLAVYALFNCLFSILDTLMASHLGTIDVSSVAYFNQLRMILNSIGSGLITGSMILINRAYGAGRNDRAGELMNILIRLILIISAVFLLIIPFSPALLTLIGTPQEFIEEGTSYFNVMIVATILNFINLIYINVEKSRGRTSVIMAVNMASMILKLILTAIFIYVLDKGILHIALATLITYGAFAFYSITHLSRKGSIFRIRPSLIIHGGKGAKDIINISYPVAIEDSAFSLGKTVVNSMAAVYGAEMIGALGISNNVCGLATTFENGFSDASSSIISQNYGAGRPDRAVNGYKANIVITLSVSILAMIFLFIVDDFLFPIFATSRNGIDEAFMDMIKRIFIFDMTSCLGLAVNGAGMDFLLGLGKTRITLIINFLRIFVLRIPVLYILQRLISDGATALGVMMMISNCAIAVITTIICFRLSSKLLREAKIKS